MAITAVMAQLNLLVGDIDGNARRVVDSARRARAEFGADLVIFPELTLTAYPPEDLLLRPSLAGRIDRALAEICNAGLECAVVVGFPESRDDALYNALTVIHEGRRIASYHKQRLPNYQVFDEQRYFRPGDGPCLVELFGASVAFTICEDLWSEFAVAQASEAGARLLININASPFHAGKTGERKALLAERCRQGGFPIVYVNLVGGQDELVFDGASMAVDVAGDVRALAPAFTEGLFPLDIEVEPANGACRLLPGELHPQPMLEEQVYQALVLGVRDYVAKNRFGGVVLGLSGGIDSALTLAVAVDALGPARVQAVMMPFTYTSDLSRDVAAQQARGLGVRYSVIAIDATYQAFVAALADEFAGAAPDVSEQNLQARCRGVVLMAISNKKGLLVLTTGNKSELAVGYATLYGDMAGGFDVLKDVSKTMVYRLAKYRNRIAGQEQEQAQEAIPVAVIERPPSAELAPDQLDADSLPPYEVLDPILERYVEWDWSANRIIEDGFERETVARVVRMVDRNEYKRRQSPPGVRLTQKAFGRDRRYPITNAWQPGN